MTIVTESLPYVEQLSYLRGDLICRKQLILYKLTLSVFNLRVNVVIITVLPKIVFAKTVFPKIVLAQMIDPR